MSRQRIAPSLEGKITSAERAASLIHSGMTVGVSGFTMAGYPKMVPLALCRSGHADRLTLLTGASTGREVDGEMAKAGIVRRRMIFNSDKDMRRAVNDGSVQFIDMHIGQFPYLLEQGLGPSIDAAIVEASSVDEKGIVPTLSAGFSDVLVSRAKQVIVEVNRTVPAEIFGMHDIFSAGLAPHAVPIPITRPAERIGIPYIPCDPEKIAAIVESDAEDMEPSVMEMNPVYERIGRNVVEFLKKEIEAGRLPEALGPIQSGVGKIGNVVLQGLTDSGFRGLSMYTEVMQDAGIGLLEKGVFSSVSASALSMRKETRKRFFGHLEEWKERIVIRPQGISNSPEVIRRLGVIALNTPVEADLYGNVNSTHILGTRMVNGIGGSADYTRNARLNIFARESVTHDGKISCIVPLVSHVDHTEHDVQALVTEQGVADLRFKTPRERAELIIENCAHPDYRPLLREYLRKAEEKSGGAHTPLDMEEAYSFHRRLRDTGSMK